MTSSLWRAVFAGVGVVWFLAMAVMGANVGFENDVASVVLGGSGIDGGWPRTSIAIAENGNVYVAGSTRSSDFPVTGSSSDYAGGVDGFIALFDPHFTELIACCLFGGVGDDNCTSVAIGEQGDVYVAGYTSSSSFPTSVGAHRSTRRGSDDVFVMRWDADLSQVSGSTLLGGRGSDTDPAISLDSAGRVIVAGRTTSSDFSTTAGAFDESYDSRGGSRGAGNVFVSRLSGDLAHLEASTLLGGSMADDKPSLAIAKDGSVYVSGTTGDELFPITDGAHQVAGGMGFWIYVSRLDPSLSELLASTFIGQACFGYDLALDEEGNVWVAAHVVGPFPATGPESEEAQVSGPADAGVVCLGEDLEHVISGWLLGGSANDCAMSIALDSEDFVYVAGYTSSTDFPGYEGGARSGTDAFICAIDRIGMSLQTVATFGGDGTDEANMIALAPAGDVYVCGSTNSSSFPMGATVLGPTGGRSQLWGGDIYLRTFGE